MTIDINDPEVQKAIKDAVDSEVKGLKAKRDELLTKLADGKATAADLEQARSKLKEIEETKLKESEEYDELKSRILNEKAELEKNYNSTVSELTSTIIERDLMAALASNNVAPVYLEAAKALLKGQIEYKDGKAVAGESSVGDFIKEWAQSDTGKAFVAAPVNSGGNASGSSRPNTQSKKFSELTESEKVDIYKADPAEYKRLKDAK